MRCGAALVSCALCVASILGGAWMSRPTPVDYGPVLATASDMYAVTDAEGEPVRWYVVGKGGAGNGASADSGNSGSTDTDSANSNSGTSKVSRIPASAATLPWKVSVTYSLDGPNVEANEVAGASGLIGVYIDIKPQTKEANRTIPVVAFTVPTQVADDVSADNSITVTTQGSNTVVAAAGKAATGLEFSCYMNAKDFSMSSVALAVLPSNSSSPAVGANPDAANAANAAAQPAADTDVAQLTASAATLVDSLTDAGSGEQQQLIEQLQTLRDNERALNKSVVAERETAHKRTFEDYMAAYVGSYTTHLSGSIGTSTQLPALMGTAGELSGDTPLAQAVLDLANAVNNVSAAHQHAGAVDALDEVIRRIQQQGTTGLVDDLIAEASEEATQGSKQYADGQSQLSAAMIPYSMKYTDVYTANLSALTGGTAKNNNIRSGPNDVAGRFVWKDATFKPSRDGGRYAVVFQPDDTANYTTAETTVYVNVTCSHKFGAWSAGRRTCTVCGEEDVRTNTVTVTWGELAYTYTDGAWNPATHAYDIGGGWAPNRKNGDVITVQNEGANEVRVRFQYTKTDTAIGGSFANSDGDGIYSPIALPVNRTKTVRLCLAGRPDKALDNEKIGSVTVRLEGGY